MKDIIVCLNTGRVSCKSARVAGNTNIINNEAPFIMVNIFSCDGDGKLGHLISNVVYIRNGEAFYNCYEDYKLETYKIIDDIGV